eukprot:PhM_4_TR11928/c0_g1_i1/m.23327
MCLEGEVGDELVQGNAHVAVLRVRDDDEEVAAHLQTRVAAVAVQHDADLLFDAQVDGLRGRHRCGRRGTALLLRRGRDRGRGHTAFAEHLGGDVELLLAQHHGALRRGRDRRLLLDDGDGLLGPHRLLVLVLAVHHVLEVGATHAAADHALLLHLADGLGAVPSVLGGLLHLLLLHCLGDLLLDGGHLEVLHDLVQRDVLVVPLRNDLVEGKEDVEGTLLELLLADGVAELRHNRAQEPQHAEVVDDVALPRRDDDQVEILEGLVQVAHRRRLQHRVLLLAGADELGEGGEQTLDAHAGHLHELAREEDLAGLVQNSCREDGHRSCCCRLFVFLGLGNLSIQTFQ